MLSGAPHIFQVGACIVCHCCQRVTPDLKKKNKAFKLYSKSGRGIGQQEGEHNATIRNSLLDAGQHCFHFHLAIFLVPLVGK